MSARVTKKETDQAKLQEYLFHKAHLHWLMKTKRCTGFQAIHCLRDIRKALASE